MNKQVGIGLRHCHFQDVLEQKPELPVLEVHTENFFSPGSIASHHLQQIAGDYKISAHGVGLSLGSADELSKNHLHNIKNFIARYNPVLVSDHLSWSSVDGVFMNDLLPVPYTEEALSVVCNNIDKAQDFLKRQMLIENPSAYIQFKQSEISEPEFMAEIAKRTGCGILLDINNIYVTAHNHGLDAEKYLEVIPVQYVKEMHLAGYQEVEINNHKLLIDTHGAKTFAPVWKLYEQAVKKFGRVTTIIEWDTDVPALNVLLDEAKKAQDIMDRNAMGKKAAGEELGNVA